MKKRTVKYVHSDYLIRQADKNPAVKNRASLTHKLIASYGLLTHVQLLEPKVCNPVNLRGFHNHDYLQQLQNCQDYHNASCSDDESDLTFEQLEEAEKYGLGFDCPIWSTIYDYVRCIAGATMTACDALCKSKSTDPTNEIVINWTGGWHHAHRDKAGGYCYVNDIVLGVLILRKRFKRIFYLDLDIHHGDGVQEAFEIAKRVFTLSFHQYECGFYPATGDATDCGFSTGKGYAANFPYRSGITGEIYKKYFKRIVKKIFMRYKPDVCVIQCGADAIVGDPLGGSNLKPQDLIECITFVLDHNLPSLLLGGGGYNFPNASRYWTQLTATICGQSLSDDIPDITPNFLEYGPDYSLEIKTKPIKDLNTEEYLNKCARIIEENLEKFNVVAV